MNALELLEYLAMNARYKSATLASLLSVQDNGFRQAYSNNNTQYLREYLSKGKALADKTTIFQI